MIYWKMLNLFCPFINLSFIRNLIQSQQIHNTVPADSHRDLEGHHSFLLLLGGQSQSMDIIIDVLLIPVSAAFSVVAEDSSHFTQTGIFAEISRNSRGFLRAWWSQAGCTGS